MGNEEIRMKKKENHFLKIITLECVIFLIFTCVGTFFNPFPEAKEKEWENEESLVWQDYFNAMESLENVPQANQESHKDENFQEQGESENNKVLETEEQYAEKIKLKKQDDKNKEITSQKLGASYIKIKKEGVQNVWGELQHDYFHKKFFVVLYGKSWSKMKKEDVCTVWQGRNYALDEMAQVPISFRSHHYQKSTQEDKKQDSILLQFNEDRVFSYEICQDEDYVYITFRNPKEVYDKIVVVDAGHGGKDTGTYAKFGNWDEKDFNLDFAEKVEESWNHDNIKLYFSRLKDTKVTLAQRVEFANSIQADLFISLHCNSTDENAGSGLEVLYKSNEYKEESQSFAEECLKYLAECTGFSNRGVLDGNSIYIIRESKMPTVLLELGFLSDDGDLNYLYKEENRKKMAETICRLIWEQLQK